jgi:hypothetical protein
MKDNRRTYWEVVNKTARSAGAVGARALVPRVVREMEKNTDASVLDFGSGPEAIHARLLKGDGWSDVTAYDCGYNISKHTNPIALSFTYEIIFASNVLNVQPSHLDLLETLDEILACCEKRTRVYLNYPVSPRKSKLSVDTVRQYLEHRWYHVEKVAGTASAPVWMCAGAKYVPSNVANSRGVR